MTLRLETLEIKTKWSTDLNLASDPNYEKRTKNEKQEIAESQQKDFSSYSEEYESIKQNASISASNWQDVSNKLAWLIKDRKLIEEQWIALEEQELRRDSSLFSDALSQFNSAKNRYLNVAPYNSTRVTLTTVEDDQGADYINASYVASGSKIYIAAQAPLESGIREWYLMLYENFVFTVLMLTKFEESGVEKATNYFPTLEKGFSYEDVGLQVCLESAYQLTPDIVVRKILLQTGNEPPRSVTHYHFVGWPDHGTPEPFQLYEMKRLIDEDYKTNAWLYEFPQVVHCSAGIGRTGTWICLCTLIEDYLLALQQNQVPIFNLMQLVENIRNQRSGMLTSIDQYEFIYQALLSEISKRYPPYTLDQAPSEFKVIRSNNTPSSIQNTRDLHNTQEPLYSTNANAFHSRRESQVSLGSDSALRMTSPYSNSTLSSVPSPVSNKLSLHSYTKGVESPLSKASSQKSSPTGSVIEAPRSQTVLPPVLTSSGSSTPQHLYASPSLFRKDEDFDETSSQSSLTKHPKFTGQSALQRALAPSPNSSPAPRQELRPMHVAPVSPKQRTKESHYDRVTIFDSKKRG